MALKFGIEFVPKDAYWKLAAYALQAEKQGFDNLWVTDHYGNRNVYVSLAAAALYTNKITFGTGVTNPWMVNPVITAQAIATLNELAPGRVVLGIGAGDKTTLEAVGIEMGKPMAAVRESIEMFRKLTAGEKVEFQGDIFKASGAKLNFKVANKIPVYVGAQGPKMLEMAGKIGDGVLVNASHPSDIQFAVQMANQGLEQAGKSPADFDITAYTSFSVNEDPKKAVKAAAPVVAFIVAGSPAAVLEKHKIDVAKADELRTALKAGDFPKAIGAVTPEMLNAFSICGTPDMCIEKIAALQKIGIGQFVVGSPIGSNVKASIDLIGQKIIPHFK
ncbi:MAG: 5,10-methylenetetrahydromethanopterin reductase [Candidatus Bathyarchaeota archaeon]|nr:5,10-methylenetetrahydromethanopterin reductase [Candidatus Bathyarchaeota archaeon]